jgi:PAS domain S-box-containing protein
VTSSDDDEESLLRSVALQNARSILAARLKAERELIEAKEALELKTRELAESLSMMKATLESTTDGILVTDDGARITDYNQKFLSMWGLPPEVLESRDHARVIDTLAATMRDPSQFRARIQEIYDTRPPESFDVLSCEDGRVYERFTKIQFVDGRGVGRVWCFRDITEHLRAEQQRQILLDQSESARREADSANRAKDEFLAVVSHELRTPLNAIVGWAAMLLEDKLSAEKQRHAIEVIDRNAKAQGRLIDDLLDVTRIISGKVRLSVEPVNPMDFVRSAVEAVGPAALAKDIRLVSTLDPEAGTLMGDRDRLQQIVWNLLTNAIKFTPKHGTVHVRMRRQDSSVEIIVEDNGQGIPSEFVPYMFDRFRQADSTFTRSKGGLGLGLAIVRHLVELHRGTIEAQSDGVGRGATFRLLLPVAPMRQPTRASGTDDSRSPVRRGTLPSLPLLEGLRVLVVDDERDAREMVQAMLEHCRATVTLAPSSQEALELVQRLRPDVLVSDIGMPGEDGYDLIRQIRALPSDAGGRTPAVALTAFARPADRTEALRAGFDVHVSKPIDPAELAIVIGNLFARHRRS